MSTINNDHWSLGQKRHVSVWFIKSCLRNHKFVCNFIWTSSVGLSQKVNPLTHLPLQGTRKINISHPNLHPFLSRKFSFFFFRLKPGVLVLEICFLVFDGRGTTYKMFPSIDFQEQKPEGLKSWGTSRCSWSVGLENFTNVSQLPHEVEPWGFPCGWICFLGKIPKQIQALQVYERNTTSFPAVFCIYDTVSMSR